LEEEVVVVEEVHYFGVDGEKYCPFSLQIVALPSCEGRVLMAATAAATGSAIKQALPRRRRVV
jgi:hypothetical protein